MGDAHKAYHIHYLGKKYPVVFIIDASALVRVELAGERAFVTMPENKEALLPRIMKEWYRWTAKHIFYERVNFWAEKMQVSYHRICIKNQKTRWGSCSIRKNLNFNMRLVMAPLDVIDYIVIHELAHLIEMNHSKRFWQIVKEVCPDYQKQKAWLKEYGANLII